MIPNAVQHYIQQYHQQSSLRCAEDKAVCRAREQALDYFATQGFPTTALEAWRYTPLTTFQKKLFQFLPVIQSDKATVSPYYVENSCNLFFIEGVFHSTLSDKLPEGVVFSSAMSAPLLECYPNSLVALNQALMHDGFVLQVKAGVVVEAPVHLCFITTGLENKMMHLRHHIQLETGSQLTLCERYVCAAEKTAEFCNVVMSVDIQSGSHLKHEKIISTCLDAYHVSYTKVNQRSKSHYQSTVVTLNGLLNRSELQVDLQGESASCDVAGLYAGSEKSAVEQHVAVSHLQPNTRSRECYKGILNHEARGVFEGSIYVTREAQGTDAALKNRNILLSASSQVNTKPRLEIYADDVKCAHGATTGHLDESALFYMQSRGISYDEARQWLLMAFSEEVLSRLTLTPLRDALSKEIACVF